MIMSNLQAHLKSIPSWKLSAKENSISKTYPFSTYLQGIEFVNKVARLAESANHHPDILIKYHQVIIDLQTHDAGGLTEKDFSLARQIDQI